MSANNHQNAGAVTGGPLILLRIEGLSVFAGMTALYAIRGPSWWLYAALLLAPDLSLIGYLAGRRIGAIIYNAGHSYVGPMSLGLIGFATQSPLTLTIVMIWLAHIGMDRAVGYGLKYTAGFGFTHLGRVGRKAMLPAAISDSGGAA